MSYDKYINIQGKQKRILFMTKRIKNIKVKREISERVVKKENHPSHE